MSGYFYANPAEYERISRANASAGFQQAMAAAKTEASRTAFMAQRDLAALALGVELEVLRLLNEGCDEALVAKVAGVAIGNIICNVVSMMNGDDALSRLFDGIDAALASAAGEDVPGVTVATASCPVTPSGRA